MSDSDEVVTRLSARFAPTPAPDVEFELAVIEGPDAGLSAVISGSEPGEVLLGQSSACTVVLTDGEVSRRHLALEVIGSKLRVRDLGSTNGTFVGGVQILEGLLDGDQQLRVGATTLTVTCRSASRAAVLPRTAAFGRMVGASREMRRLYPLLERLAAAQIAVLVEGETGTGKELLAESLHEQSARSSGPFVVLDCTAIPGNLMESELFGHERGAFTGATQARAGLFELAHGGTLFIDEIGELDRALQPKLLRAIERLEVRRVGGQRRQTVDVRVIAATNKNLETEVQQGAFREDLFHRLAVGRVELPPLRRRRGDIGLLVRHFTKALGARDDDFDEEVLRRWEQYDWPGNVRELRNAVLKRMALGDLAEPPPLAKSATTDQAPDWLGDILSRELPMPRARQLVIEEFQRRYVADLLRRHDGNVRRAAEAAGVARRYFQALKARSQRS